MPEAAEVEQTRRSLQFLKGQVLRAAIVSDQLELSGQEQLLYGQRLEAINRHGKRLAFIFPQQVLLCHLRMTGRWLKGEVESKASRAILRFAKDSITFLDPRGFATLSLTSKEDWRKGLGPDLLSLPAEWQPPQAVQRSKRTAKSILLDQSIVAGIGNYLADESLWQAQVAPKRQASLITAAEWVLLYRSAHQLAEKVLTKGGVSLRDFFTPDGKSGQGASLLQVYGRAGQPCLRCQTRLQKSKVAGRGTTFCPRCQS